MAEIWKAVPGYDGMYEVSDHGRVRSWLRHGGHPGRRQDPRILKQQNSHGYPVLFLCKARQRRNMKVHRLVLAAFVGPCPPGMEACHNDGVRTNNHLANLRWDTRSANALDGFAHGTRVSFPPHLQGEAHSQAKLTEEQVIEIRRLYAAGGVTYRTLGQQFSVAHASIWNIIRRETWIHLP